MGNRRLARRLLATAALHGLAAPAWAQEAELPRLADIETVTVEEGADLDVRERNRPEFQPAGYRAGAWQIYPSVGLSTGFDNNLYASRSDRVSEPYLQVEPAISAQRNGSRGTIAFDASGRFARFLNQGPAEENSYRVAGAASRELSSTSSVAGGIEHEQLVERRDSSEYPTGRVAPSTYLRTRFYGSFQHQTGRFGALATVDYTMFDYRDTDALSASGERIARIDQDSRDQNTLRGSLRGMFSVTPALGLFAQGVISSIDYRRAEILPGIPTPSGTEYTALGGVALQPGSLIRGSIGVGYVWRTYRNDQLRSVGGLAINADVRYFVTPLVTLSATGSRTVEEAVFQGARGYVSDHYTLRADYELLRPLILNVRGGYQHNDFRSLPRRDRIYDVGGGARYMASRHLQFDLDANYIERDVRNDPAANSFNEFRLIAGARYSF